MKRRIARKVIKYGMSEVRGKYSSFLKAIAICPKYYNFLKFKEIMILLRHCYDGAATPSYKESGGHIFILGQPDSTFLTDGTNLLLEIKGKKPHVPHLPSSCWD